MNLIDRRHLTRQLRLLAGWESRGGTAPRVRYVTGGQAPTMVTVTTSRKTQVREVQVGKAWLARELRIEGHEEAYD